MAVNAAAARALPVAGSWWAARLRSLAASLLAVVLAAAIGAGLIAMAGSNPVRALSVLATRTFGSQFSWGLVLIQVVPLLTIGLGLAVAFRARIWNIGAEGQFYVGAIAAGAFALTVPISTPLLMVPAAMVAGIVGGAAWGWVVGVLRGRWNVNEVITSLLLNYVAIFLVGYLVRKPLGDPESFLRQTDQLPRAALLPYLHALRVHGGILVALALVPVVAYVMRRTPFGFRLDLLGSNPEAARTAGVDTARMTVLVMLVSGGLAGLAGALQVMGQETRVTAEISPGFGFTAIVVALLGRNRPLGVLVSALFIAGLSIGGVTMQTVEQVPSAIVVAVEALFVLFLLVADRMARRAG